MSTASSPRIGIVWRGDITPEPPRWETTRLRSIFECCFSSGVEAVPVPYADHVADRVRAELLALDGALVWVNPIHEGQNRTVLDGLLREVAAAGVWVSAHPEVILKMGTKDVLYATRELSWGSKTHIYATLGELRDGLPRALVTGPRVLKQHRGHSGYGVWKVELAEPAAPIGADPRLHVLHALAGSSVEELSLEQFLARCEDYFTGSGCVVEQPFQPRLADGMVRCYLTRDRVVGFGQQYVSALLAPPGGPGVPVPPAQPRLYYGPSQPEFQELKAKVEGGWVAELQGVVGVEHRDLPVIWDADFLYGPKTPTGEDTYVLCEINVSCVFPMPGEAVQPLVDAARESTLEAKRRRA